MDMRGPTDLSSCDREPIQIPGSIQPHGIMLVVDLTTGLVCQAAGEVERRLGIAGWDTPPYRDNLPLSTFIGAALGAKVMALRETVGPGGFVGQCSSEDEGLDPRGLDVSAHVSGHNIIVELEPASVAPAAGSLLLDRLAAAVARFQRAGPLKALCDQAAVEFRHLTGFDRVMVYRFLESRAGHVIAEDRRGDMHAFLNHHFPASDIPKQARALYLRNLIRVIPDVTYQPVPLRSAVTPQSVIDMSDSSLRSVSPIHLQYLKNMGVLASASVSIVKNGVLWGLIACHNETPRALAYEIRGACRSLAASFAVQLGATEDMETYRQQTRLRGFEDDMVTVLSREGSLNEALPHHLDEMCRMMSADGLAVLRGTDLATYGPCPDDMDIRVLAVWLLSRGGEPVFWTENLSIVQPTAAAFQARGSGVLSVILSTDEPWLLLWFRAEQVETVNWAGNPHKSAAPGAITELTPRASFAAWRETVNGRSRKWTLAEVDAANRMRISILDHQQHRRVQALNRQLTQILQDKDLLLQQKEFLVGEVHHRVQNSLQMVSSFLRLQVRESDDPALHAALDEARKRLSAVALVHDRLYRGEQIGMVDAARYIEELCADTFSFKGSKWMEHLTLNLSPVLVTTDRAITLGLVLTELIINTTKHAYDGGMGPIEVGLAENNTHVQMAVADKGKGKTSLKKGFGSRIVEGLVSQLGGELAYSDNLPGLRTELRIPIHES